MLRYDFSRGVWRDLPGTGPLARAPLDAGAPVDARVRALVMAADHQRLAVIDQLVAAGTPVDAVDPRLGGQALRTAAANGRSAGVRHLLALGADPSLLDADGAEGPGGG